jgi:hypothetical protein
MYPIFEYAIIYIKNDLKIFFHIWQIDALKFALSNPIIFFFFFTFPATPQAKRFIYSICNPLLNKIVPNKRRENKYRL